MKRIIIADDHSLFREGVKKVLKEAFPFAEIDDAGDAVDLLKKLSSQAYSLVISDISMPGLSGIDALKAIKEEYPQIPVLILSMYPAEQYALRALKSGASGYLTKETALTELVTAVDQILNGKKYITGELTYLLADSLGNDSLKPLHEQLSDREFEVLKLVVAGKSTTEIAEQLFLSKNTISTYKSRIMEKMNLHTNAEIIKYAIDNRLI